MPELPEVETIARALRAELPGRKITSSRLLWKRTLAMPSPAAFARRITGQRILDVSRRAKYLWVHLSEDNLFIHLRMTGDVWVKPGKYRPAVHDRLILGLSGGKQLVFNDPRKFGRIWLAATPEEVIGRLGPEPLDAAFTARDLHERLGLRHRQLKPLLLDQSFIAGLGNIYTDEALHRARVHPLRLSDTITFEEAGRLRNAVRKVLQTGIRHNGASIDWAFRGGEFQNYFRVYGREGEACPVCGTPIRKILVGQRGTHFCPLCQVR